MLIKVKLDRDHTTIEDAALVLGMAPHDLDNDYGPVKIGPSLYAVRTKPGTQVASIDSKVYADTAVRPFG